MRFIHPILVPRQKYCESVHKTVRRKTRTVMIGNVALGSEHPIRVQTMTTSDTKDVAGTVEEVRQIYMYIIEGGEINLNLLYLLLVHRIRM